MTNALTAALRDAATHTLEDMCFLCDAPEMASEYESTPLVAYARVRFTGPRTGRLEVRVAQDLLPVIAANMLGLDESDAAEQFDALGEIANVICGNVLPALHDDSAVFDIAAPETGTGKEHDPSRGEQPVASVRLALDYGPATTLLFVDGD
jgi:CheY-specific phosphatase CheX